jgi:hypothetical protein
LRDEKKLLPADANALAATICRQLSSAMAMPTNQPLQGYRIIGEWPPHESDFKAELAKKIADVNDRVAAELWKIVYDRGRDLPAVVADPRSYWPTFPPSGELLH